VRRQGRRSLWKAHYEVMRGENVILTIREKNPWAKVGDALLTEVPGLGLFAGHLFHPRYAAFAANGAEVLLIAKQPAMFEGRYSVDKRADLTAADEAAAVLSLLMMLLLERRRG
jgi:hypothetical protein